MKLIYPDQGLESILSQVLDNGIKVKLYKNDVTPTRSTVLADLTEADWTGYAEVALDETDFDTSGVVANVGFKIGDPVSFANGSGSSKSAYGYYVTNAAEDKLLAVARFDSAPIAKADGANWLVTPAFACSSAQS